MFSVESRTHGSMIRNFFMKEKNRFLLIPNELLIEIFAYSDPDLTDIFFLSLVCKHWQQITEDRKIWQPLFIQRFAYDPIPVYGNFFIKEQYKKQLLINRKMISQCVGRTPCDKQPGLVEVIKEKNIPKIYALLLTEHLIDVSKISKEPLTFDTLLNFLLECTDLPPIIFAAIMQPRFCNGDTKRLPVLPLHEVISLADKASFIRIIKALGDELFELSRWCDAEQKNFLSVLTLCELKRFKWVLEALKDTLGEEKLSQLLIYQQPEEDFSYIHEVVLTKRRLFITLNYLKKQDYSVFITEGTTSADIPLFKSAIYSSTETFTRVLDFLGDQAKPFLKHQNSAGKTILYYILQDVDCPNIFTIIEFMGEEFINLLKLRDNKDRTLFHQLFKVKSPDVLQYISNVLQLLTNFDALDMAQDFYDSHYFNVELKCNPFLDIESVQDVFEIYGVERGIYTPVCTLL